MDFASKFILANDEDEYESISEEEFEQGMQVSGSGSSDDEDDSRSSRCVSLSAAPALSSDSCDRAKKKKKVKHHWKRKSYSAVSEPPPRAITGGGKKESNNRRFRMADTNVVSVNFNTLLSPGNMHAGEPVACSKCSAILSHISKVDATSKTWKCEFCDEPVAVDIEPEEIPTTEDVTFLLEPAMTTSSSTMSGLDQSLVVFCVDTSGSMCVTTEVSGKIKLRGTSHLRRLQSFNDTNENQFLPSQRDHAVTYISRLQAMQAAVDHQLGEMAKNHPNRRVALITFNNEVTIVGDGSQEQIIVAGDKLTSEEQLCKAGSEAALPQAVRGSRKVLGEKVYSLEEGGATALGPALTVAVNLAAHHPGSKVILCTDGKANVGLGKLEEASEEQAASEFYTKAAENALTKGVTVSVITIEGTDCKLVHLGMLADKTGGQVNIVDPLKLTEEFGNILADPIIATKVKATMILHKELYVVDETNPDSQLSKVEHNAGNVKSSTTITFEFTKRKRPKDAPAATSDPTKETSQTPTESGDAVQAEGASASSSTPSNISTNTPTISDFPFQLQIEYIDTEGNKALRVISRTMPATSDRKITEENANLEILGTHAAKKSADLALQGQFSKSRGKALMNQRLAWRYSNCAQASRSDRVKYKNIYSNIQQLENVVQRQQMSEYQQFGRTRSESESSSSDEVDNEDMLGGSSEKRYQLLPLAAPPAIAREARKTKGYIATKFKKMHAERTSEMDDGMANMMYKFRSVGADEISAQAQSGDKDSASGSGVNKDSTDKKDSPDKGKGGSKEK